MVVVAAVDWRAETARRIRADRPYGPETWDQFWCRVGFGYSRVSNRTERALLHRLLWLAGVQRHRDLIMDRQEDDGIPEADKLALLEIEAGLWGPTAAERQAEKRRLARIRRAHERAKATMPKPRRAA